MSEQTKAYYQAHREELRKAAREKYWTNRENRLSYSRKYRSENKDLISKKQKMYRDSNHEKIIASQKESRVKYSDKRRKEHVEYRAKNRERFAVYESNRRARKRGVEGALTVLEWKEIKSKYKNTCLCCKKRKKLTIDHVIPLALGGKHVASNVQPLCLICNCKKHAKHIDYRISFNAI